MRRPVLVWLLSAVSLSAGAQESATQPLVVDTQDIETRLPALPGRTLQDLINSEPGWLYEGNAVLHPRGSEYQTQFVLDGVPLVDNRSPSFGPEIEADDVDAMTIYTAGIPAEFGRKLGGVVELTTRHEATDGTHGALVLGGGSYATADGYGRLQQVRGVDAFTVTASGGRTSHYLNPVVPQNYTNSGTTGDFSSRYEHAGLSLSVRHEFSHFEIPNEFLQQQAGQLQTGGNAETIGVATFRATGFDAALMVRDNQDDLQSNPESTPILATQHNRFREVYFKSSYKARLGRSQLRAGVETDNTFLHENFAYTITDPTRFDDSTPPTLAFQAQRPDLEQSAYLEDRLIFAGWSISAGLRYDHYQLLLNQWALSPRLALARSLPFGWLAFASYDRIFQTPSSENILISSSPAIQALNDNFLRLPVQPSRGNYYEGGLSNTFTATRLDIRTYRRDVRNYADDDQLLNTGVSYPIAFDKAVIYGAEAKLTLVQLGRLSGFASYSYMVGNAWYPVTGGLFLGDDASAANSQTSGHFPDSQDQRNTLRARLRYMAIERVTVGAGLSYGSGLPFEYQGDEPTALAEYGPAVIRRIDFERGRVRPSLSVNASLETTLMQHKTWSSTLQASGDNLNNRLNVIDFGGLFSGNAIAPARSWGLRLSVRR